MRLSNPYVWGYLLALCMWWHASGGATSAGLWETPLFMVIGVVGALMLEAGAWVCRTTYREARRWRRVHE